jgi:hypothetical protein
VVQVLVQARLQAEALQRLTAAVAVAVEQHQELAQTAVVTEQTQAQQEAAQQDAVVVVVALIQVLQVQAVAESFM